MAYNMIGTGRSQEKKMLEVRTGVLGAHNLLKPNVLSRRKPTVI
jgi:hypothetical protein